MIYGLLANIAKIAVHLKKLNVREALVLLLRTVSLTSDYCFEYGDYEAAEIIVKV